MYNHERASDSQHCSADNVGKVMRTEVHSGEPDQNRDWQTCKTDAAAGEN